MSTISRPRVPEGLRDVMKDLTREILKDKPTDIYEFAENYFQSRLPQKENYTVKDFEPTSVKYDFSYIKNPQRYQVPVALVYSIIPEGLTNLIKDLIKAVLREQPDNLCDFAVEYFRHLKTASQTEMAKEISYTTYENYFINKERFLFTPFVKCTCGRTFGEGFGSGYQLEQLNSLHHVHHNESVYKLETIATNLEDTNNNVKDVLQNDTTYSEKYLESIYVIQRYVRRYLERKSTATRKDNCSNSSSPNLSTMRNKLMSEETAAIIAQRTLRTVFGGGGESPQQLDSSGDKIPIVPQLHFNQNENDNVSETASYTSASTAQLSASESGRETSELSTAENIFRNTILEGEEIDNDHENIAHILTQSQIMLDDDTAQISDSKTEESIGTNQTKDSETIVHSNEEKQTFEKRHADPNIRSSAKGDFKKDEPDGQKTEIDQNHEENLKGENKKFKEGHDKKQHTENVLDDSTKEVDSIEESFTKTPLYDQDLINKSEDTSASKEDTSTSKEDAMQGVPDEEKEQTNYANINETIESTEQETLDEDAHKTIQKLNKDIIQSCNEIQRKNSTEVHKHDKESTEMNKFLRNNASVNKNTDNLNENPDEIEKEAKLDKFADDEATENSNTIIRSDLKENNYIKDANKKGNEIKHENEVEELKFNSLNKSDQKQVDNNIATRFEGSNTSVGESKRDDNKSTDKINAIQSTDLTHDQANKQSTDERTAADNVHGIQPNMSTDRHENELKENKEQDNKEETKENILKQKEDNENITTEASNDLVIKQEDINSTKYKNQRNDQELDEEMVLQTESVTDDQKFLPASNDLIHEDHYKNSEDNDNNDFKRSKDTDFDKINKATDQNLSRKSADIELEKELDNKDLEKEELTRTGDSAKTNDDQEKIGTELTGLSKTTIDDNLIENKSKILDDDSSAEAIQYRSKRETQSPALETVEEKSRDMETGEQMPKLNFDESNENHDEIRNHGHDPEHEHTNKFTTNEQQSNHSNQIEQNLEREEIHLVQQTKAVNDDGSNTDIGNQKDTANSDHLTNKTSEESDEAAAETIQPQKDVKKTEIITEDSITKESAIDVLEQDIETANNVEILKTAPAPFSAIEAFKDQEEFKEQKRGDKDNQDANFTTVLDKQKEKLVRKALTEDNGLILEQQPNETILNDSNTVLNKDEIQQEEKLGKSESSDSNEEKSDGMNAQNIKFIESDLNSELKIEELKPGAILKIHNSDKQQIYNVTNEDPISNTSALENNDEPKNNLKSETRQLNTELRTADQEKLNDEPALNDLKENTVLGSEGQENDLNKSIMNKTNEGIVAKNYTPLEVINDANETLVSKSEEIKLIDQGSTQQFNKSITNNSEKASDLESEELQLQNNESIVNESVEQMELEKNDKSKIIDKLTLEELKQDDNKTANNEVLVLGDGAGEQDTQNKASFVNEFNETTDLASEDLEQLNKTANNSNEVSILESPKQDAHNNSSNVNEIIEPAKLIPISQDETSADKKESVMNNQNIIISNSGLHEQTESNQGNTNGLQKADFSNDNEQTTDDYQNSRRSSCNDIENIDTPNRESDINDSKIQSETPKEDDKNVEIKDKILDSEINDNDLTQITKDETTEVSEIISNLEQAKYKEDNLYGPQYKDLLNESKREPDVIGKKMHNDEMKSDTLLDTLNTDNSLASQELNAKSSLNELKEKTESKSEALLPEANKIIEINDKTSGIDHNIDKLTKSNKKEANEIEQDIEKSELLDQNMAIPNLKVKESGITNADNLQKNDLLNKSKSEPDMEKDDTENVNSSHKLTAIDSEYNEKIENKDNKSALIISSDPSETNDGSAEINVKDNINHEHNNSDAISIQSVQIGKSDNEVNDHMDNKTQIDSDRKDQSDSFEGTADNLQNNDLNTKNEHDLSKDSTENFTSFDNLMKNSENKTIANIESKISSGSSESNNGPVKSGVDEEIKLEHNNSELTSIQKSGVGDSINEHEDQIEHETKIDSDSKKQAGSNEDNLDNQQRNDTFNKTKNDPDLNNDSTENISSSVKLAMEGSERNEKNDNKDHKSDHEISSDPSETEDGIIKANVEEEIKLKHNNLDPTSIQSSAIDDSGNDIKDKLENKTESKVVEIPILLQDQVNSSEEKPEATNNKTKLIQESTITEDNETNNEANKNSENDIDEERHKILSERLQLLRIENEENILSKDRTENKVCSSTNNEDEIKSLDENFNNKAVQEIENDAKQAITEEFNKEFLKKSNSEKEIFKNDESNNDLEKAVDNSYELNLIPHSGQESNGGTNNDQNEVLPKQNRMKRSFDEEAITENKLKIENMEEQSLIISTENIERSSNEKFIAEEAKNQVSEENPTHENINSSKPSDQETIDIGSETYFDNSKSINDQETTLHNIGNKSPETIIGNQNLNIGRGRNYNEGLIGSFSGQRFAETHLKSFWKEHQMNNGTPIGQYIEFGDDENVINNLKLKEDKEIGNDSKDPKDPTLDLNNDDNPKPVEEVFIKIDKQNLNASISSNLPQSAILKESNEESENLAKNDNNQNMLEIINNAMATDNDANKSLKTFERIPRYFLGLTPTTEKENLLDKRKSYKEPTSFTVPFDKSTDSTGKSSMENNIHDDEERGKFKKVKQINLENCANVEEPLLDSETPTKLFKDLNEFEYDETHDIDLEITYTLDEILRLKTEHDSEQNSDENEDNNEIDLIEYTPMLIRLTSETHKKQKSNETDENVGDCSEFSETPESMLQTIIELSESETPRPDSKTMIFCADLLQPSDEDFLNNLENTSDSTNTSWTTGSKDTEDNSFVSDEFLEDENYHVDKASEKAESKHKTEGGIYEYSNAGNISQEVELKNNNYENLIQLAPTPPNDDPYYEDAKEIAAEKIQKCYRKYLKRKREISQESNEYSEEIIKAKQTFIMAVCTIQKAFRNYLRRRNHKNSEKSEQISEPSKNDKAAIVIQKAFRQYFERKEQLGNKPQLNDSKADTESKEDNFKIWDSILTPTKNNEYSDEIVNAQKTLIMAVYTIQKAFRSYKLRKEEQDVKKILDISVVDNGKSIDGENINGSIQDSDTFSNETTKIHTGLEKSPTELKHSSDQSQNTTAAIVIQTAFRQYLDHKSKFKTKGDLNLDINRNPHKEINNEEVDVNDIDINKENYVIKHPSHNLSAITGDNSIDNMDIIIEKLNQDNLNSTKYENEELENLNDNDNCSNQPQESFIIETNKIITNFSEVDRIKENVADNSSQNDILNTNPITADHAQNLTSISNEKIMEFNYLISEFINSEREYSDVVNQQDLENQLLRTIKFQTPDVNKITKVIAEFAESQKLQSDSMVLSPGKLDKASIEKSLSKSVKAGDFNNDTSPNELLAYESVENPSKNEGEVNKTELIGNEITKINNDKFENSNANKISLKQMFKDSSESTDIVIEKFNQRELTGANTANAFRNLGSDNKLENQDIKKKVTGETHNTSLNDDELTIPNNSSMLLKEINEDSNESADVVVQNFNAADLNSENMVKGFENLRRDNDIEKIKDTQSSENNNLNTEIILDNLVDKQLDVKHFEVENPNKIKNEFNESMDVMVEKNNLHEVNNKNLVKKILNEENLTTGNIADNITSNKTEEDFIKNIDGENVPQGFESLSAKDEYEIVKIDKNPTVNRNERSNIKEEKDVENLGNNKTEIVPVNLTEKQILTDNDENSNHCSDLLNDAKKDPNENIEKINFKKQNSEIIANDYEHLNENIDLENLNIDNNLTDETKERINKVVENNTENLNQNDVNNESVINKLTPDHNSKENIEEENNKNENNIDNYDVKEQSDIVEIINDNITQNQTNRSDENVQDMNNKSKSLGSTGPSKELAAAIIQKAFRSYVANKNATNTLSYLNNETIYFEPSAPTEDDLISSSPSSTLDNPNSIHLHEEKAARILQKALRKFVERKSKLNSINDAEIAAKSNWFVGTEPIVAKESLSRTLSQISFDETEAYVELKDNSQYLVDSSSNLEKSDANNFSRSPTAQVSSRSNSVDLNNDKQTNLSEEIVSVVGTGIKAIQLMQKDQGNLDVPKEVIAEQVAEDNKSLEESQNVSPPPDNNDEILVALHQENLASNKMGNGLKYNNLIGQFINSERQYSDSVNQLNPSFKEIEFKTPNVSEITKILTDFVDSQNAFKDSAIPYEKLEEPCIKRKASKSLITTDSKDEANRDEDVSTSSDIDNDTEDSLSTKTVKLQGPEMAIEKMQQRRDSTTKISSLDKPKEYNFDEPLVEPIDNLDTDEEGIVVNKMQREETRESSAQSDIDVVICGDNEETLDFFENIDFDTHFPPKGSLKRVHTIAGDVDAKALLKNVTIDESIKYIEPPDYEVNSGSLCLDDDTSENIRRKMMAYSLSEADSDYFDKTVNNPSNTSVDVKSPKYDDFNVSTALVDNGDTSTETESTIVSAVTKIQAGARGYLTRKRLGRTSLTSDYKSLPQDDTSKASFGNAAISESLEHLVQEAAAKRIQKVYRKHYRQKLADMNQPDDSISPELTTSMESSLAQKRSIMLQRGDALRNDSTPDEGNSSSNGSDNGKYRDEQKEKLKISGESITLSNSNESKSSDEQQLKKYENNTPSQVKTSTAANRAKKIEENKIRWLALRQNSMPVQIDSEVLRVIPKYMRKKIKSADGEKKKGRRRVLKD